MPGIFFQKSGDEVVAALTVLDGIEQRIQDRRFFREDADRLTVGIEPGSIPAERTEKIFSAGFPAACDRRKPDRVSACDRDSALDVASIDDQRPGRGVVSQMQGDTGFACYDVSSAGMIEDELFGDAPVVPVYDIDEPVRTVVRDDVESVSDAGQYACSGETGAQGVCFALCGRPPSRIVRLDQPGDVVQRDDHSRFFRQFFYYFVKIHEALLSTII